MQTVLVPGNIAPYGKGAVKERDYPAQKKKGKSEVKVEVKKGKGNVKGN